MISDASAATDPGRSLIEALMAVERRENAHDLTVAGVHIWSALRNELFGRLAVQTGIWQPSRATQASRWQKLKRIPQDLVWRNPFLLRARARNLIIKWERMQLWQGQLDDVVSRPLRDHLAGTRFIEMDVLGGFSKASSNAVSMSAVSVLTRILRPFFSIRLDAGERAHIQAVEAGLAREVGFPVPLASWYTEAARDFRIRKMLLRYLIRKWGVRNVFAVVAYGHPEVVAAARECGARILELQHGMIHHAHPGYEFAPEGKVAYRPDVLLLYGDYWRGTAHHYEDTHLAVCGAPYILSRIADPMPSAKRKGEVVFLSQAGVLEPIMKFALAFARLPGAPKVVLRLHPNDDVEKCNAMFAADGVGHEKFAVSVGGGGPKTLEMLAVTKYQVGVFSTAVVEGLALGCTTFLIPVPGWSALAGLIDAGYARLAQAPEALLTMIQYDDGENTHRDVTSAKDAIFAPWQPALISEFLS